MADNTLSKYDQDFADAMALKLRLSREKKQKASEVSAPSSEPSVTKEEMIFDRSKIVASVQKRHPGLTSEDLKIMEQEMAKMGY